MITIKSRGSFQNTDRFLTKLSKSDIFATLEKYGSRGVAVLAAATPTESGETAASWTYEVVRRKGYYSIIWKNIHEAAGRPIAILLQYGHGTGTGGYVPGRDYINPAIRPIFDQIAAEAWKEVTK
jgi:hypothetical protein